MTPYDLNTENGMTLAKAWTLGLISTLKEGGIWVVPRSGAMVQVFHSTETVEITAPAGEECLAQVFEALGWKVVLH